MPGLTDLIRRKPDEKTKLTIAQTMFPLGGQSGGLSRLDGYFAYYEKQLELLDFGRRFLQPNQLRDMGIITHADILHVIQILRGSGNLTKHAVRSQLGVHFRDMDAAQLNRFIDLCLRLWLMINVNDADPQLRLLSPQTPVLSWKDNQTFDSFLSNIFPQSRWQIGAKDSRLQPSFTAAFMSEVCGLNLEWTDCLADHLRLDRRQKMLRVYSYKSFLQHHSLVETSGVDSA